MITNYHDFVDRYLLTDIPTKCCPLNQLSECKKAYSKFCYKCKKMKNKYAEYLAFWLSWGG